MFQKLQITVEGLSPVMMCSWQAMLQPEDAPTTKKKKLTREEEAELKAYRNEEGQLVIPSRSFRSALMFVAASYKVPKSRKTLRGFISHVRMGQEFVSLLTLKGKPVSDYIIDSRRVVNRTTKGAMISHRPKLNEWRCTFTLLFIPELIPVEDCKDQFEKLFNDAGIRAGVGSFRLNCEGDFGAFKVIDIKEIS
jgi:hypothetical protein